jgi:hypothetical protein
MKNKLFPLTICGIILLHTACTEIGQNYPPYVITSPLCVLDERSGYYHYAGIEFELLNTAQKDIACITVSFRLFDAETLRSPFIGTNAFKFKLNFVVVSHETQEYVIPLDDYLYIAPSEPYIVDFFYISEIVYADGTTWKDTYGVFHKGNT